MRNGKKIILSLLELKCVIIRAQHGGINLLIIIKNQTGMNVSSVPFQPVLILKPKKNAGKNLIKNKALQYK